MSDYLIKLTEELMDFASCYDYSNFSDEISQYGDDYVFNRFQEMIMYELGAVIEYLDSFGNEDSEQLISKLSVLNLKGVNNHEEFLLCSK